LDTLQVIVTSDPVARYQATRGDRAARLMRLRPMATGEIVDSSLRLYQRLGLTFLRLSVLPALLCLSAFAFVTSYVVPGLLYSANDTNFLVHLGQVGFALCLAVFVGGPLFLSGLSYTTSLVVSLVADWVIGNPVDPLAAQEAARKAMPRLLVVSMKELVLSLSGVSVALAVIMLSEYLSTVTDGSDATAGLVLLVGILGIGVGSLIGMWFVARDALVAPVTVLENLNATMAGKRSRQLLKKAPIHGTGVGTIWSLYTLISLFSSMILGGILGVSSLLGVGAIVDRITSGLPFQPLLLNAWRLAPYFLTIWTLVPVWATTVTLLYFDRRVRLEGYDIEVLGRDLARGSRANRFQL